MFERLKGVRALKRFGALCLLTALFGAFGAFDAAEAAKKDVVDERTTVTGEHFFGVRLGEPIASWREMQVWPPGSLATRGKGMHYRKGDAMQLYGMEVGYIFYNFLQGGVFCQGVVTLKGEEEGRAMLAAAMDHLGETRTTSIEDGSIFANWHFDDVSILYTYNAESTRTSIMFSERKKTREGAAETKETE